MAKSYSKYDKEYSYFSQSGFQIFLNNKRKKNGKEKYRQGTINSYLSELKNSYPIINGIKSQVNLLKYLKEKCRSDMGLNQQKNLIHSLLKENKDLTRQLNDVEAYLSFLDKSMDDEKGAEFDAYKSLLKIFDDEDERKSIEKFVKLVIENCYFFSKQLVNESFETLKSGIKGESILPSRKSDRSIYYPNKNLKKGDEGVFVIPDKEKSFNNKERLKVKIDKDGNKYINDFFKKQYKNYFLLTILSLIYGGKHMTQDFFQVGGI